MTDDAFAIVILPGGGMPRIWPTGGRDKESFEAHCATCGATVVRAYPSLEEAVAALCLPIDTKLVRS